MRAWWRHWNIGTEEDAAAAATQQEQPQQTSSAAQQQQHQQRQQQAAINAAAASLFGQQAQQSQQPEQQLPIVDEELPRPLAQQLQHQPSLLHGQARQEEISSMMAAGWEAVVLKDWAASLQHLTHAWTSAAQDFDGVLGFSNGAAAAFLFAAHAAAHPEMFGSLRFVALAGGYVPEPLEKLLHPSLLAAGSTATGAGGSASDAAAPVTRLKAPLPFPSLHMMGNNDPLIDVDVATQLMQCFQAHGRVQLVHDSGHCVPQQARFMQDILKFIVSFAEIPVVPARPHGQPRRQQQVPLAAAAAAGSPVEASVAEIEAKLHRQGLREKVSKGPAKKHLLIRMDSAGQPHQHHDHLISPKAGSHTSRHQQQQHKPQQLPAQAQPVSTQPPQHPAAAAGNGAGATTPAAAAPSAAAPAQQEFGEATEMQLEEMEALEAIFSTEYSLVSSCPPTFVIKLQEQGAGDVGDGQQVPPSALFSLKFKLPQDYPSSAAGQPVVDIQGPLGAHDPARTALQQHLAAVAAEQQQELAGSGGYIWQLVGAAKEWIDANLPDDLASRKAGQFACSAAAATAATEAAASSSNGAGASGAAGSGSSSSGGVPWWEKEDVDIQLVDKATAEAAAAHWASWSLGQEDDPWGADEDDPAAAAAAAGVAAAGAGSSAEALTSAGDGTAGRWDYVVGLVGKPSAGKSTFFNAATDPVSEEDAAREGAFPFTTITANIGRGFVALPDPSPLLGLSPDHVQPAHGFAHGLDLDRVQQAGCSNIGPLHQLVKDCGWQQQQQQQQAASGSSGGSGSVLWRRVPVVVKDVAGLVPGAYQGRGRGNAFLNDLCDADVLVHVVDVSGTTDSKGVAMSAAPGTAGGDIQLPGQQPAGKADAGGEDPVEEVSWVRRELHCWVYDNVRAKWPTVLRRPSRLPGLFSGYHAPAGLVHAVLRAVGVRLEDLTAETAAMGNAGLLGGTKESAGAHSRSSSLASWGEWELHRLVAHFLAARFPILLALNKADLPSAPDNIRSVLAAYPHHAAVAVSAAAERKLHLLRRQGLLLYDDAANSADLVPGAGAGGAGSEQAAAAAAAAATAALQSIQRFVLGVYGGTGVLAALTCAVALKPPRWVFPIADREKCTALAAAPNRAGGGSSGSSSSSSSSSSSRSSRQGGSAAASSLGWGMDAKARAAQGAETGVLRDCVLVKPGSKVEDVFWVLKRPPYALLEGDFVRAEARVLSPEGKTRVVRKDEAVGPANCVLLLQTNRKVSWQHKHAAAG